MTTRKDGNYADQTDNSYRFWMEPDLPESIPGGERDVLGWMAAYTVLARDHNILLQFLIECCLANGGKFTIPIIHDESYRGTGVSVADKTKLGVKVINIDDLAPMRPLTLEIISK